MLRPSITVVTKNGTFDAMSIGIGFNGMVTIVSSGVTKVLQGSDIVRVNYHNNSAGWCPWCDQSVQHYS